MPTADYRAAGYESKSQIRWKVPSRLVLPLEPAGSAEASRRLSRREDSPRVLCPSSQSSWYRIRIRNRRVLSEGWSVLTDVRISWRSRRSVLEAEAHLCEKPPSSTFFHARIGRAVLSTS